MKNYNGTLNFGTQEVSVLNAPVYATQYSFAKWTRDYTRASFEVTLANNNSNIPMGSIQLQGCDQELGLPTDNNLPTKWGDIGSSVTMSTDGSYFLQNTELSYEYLRIKFVPSMLGAQTVIPVAETTGVKQVQTISTVADVAGNKNSKYFLLSSMNLVTKAQKNFYLWLDNGTGVDPAIAGRTGIQVTYTNGDSADTLATNIRAALNALTNDFVATGATNAVIITATAQGPLTAATDGTAATGFTFGAATLGVASSLNNKYFLLSDALGSNLYYVWFNVGLIGTDPAVAGRTAVPIAVALGDSAGTIGAAIASAVAALNATNSFSTSGTTTVTITNKVAGAFTPMADGTAATGFTFAITVGNGTISGLLEAKMAE